MESYRISYIVEQTCKKLGIDYKSPFLKERDVHRDAERLHELYLHLKQIAGELTEIEEAHNVNGLGKLLHDDIIMIEKSEHDLIKIAGIMRSR